MTPDHEDSARQDAAPAHPENTEETFTDGPKDKPNLTGDLLIGLVFITYGVLMAIGAVNFRWNPRMGVITAPAFTPILLSALIVLLSLVLIARSLWRCGLPDVRQWYRSVIADERISRSAILLLMTGAYVAMVGRVYFPVATTIYLVAMFWYLKLGRFWVVVLSGVAAGLFISVVIPGIFRMPLP